MGKVIFNMSVSLDGFIAGPNDEVDQLFKWYSMGDAEVVLPGPNLKFRVSSASAELIHETWPTIGAAVIGRRNFDVAKAWGGHPPGNGPHFVLTHSVPQKWVYEGSPFTFVTDGVESAVEQAKNVAGNKNVSIGTATVMQQCLKAGLLDELHLDVAHVLIGAGRRLFENLAEEPINLERTRVVEGTGVTHLQFRVVKNRKGE
jgi:dihydrofolate reductase